MGADSPTVRPPADVVRCTLCGRAANPMLWSPRDIDAAFCTYACRDDFNARREARGEPPEVRVVRRVLRKLRP